ncbi:Ent-kaurene oxidase [Tolypocladium capitatum]|uniref:Ent-kaurene oxidase n=1 Tax=Tolypocladium capitatum TaxID=45235 RepID=A0A2K3QIJ6_9HYPO|nr:Ent-kaurene oxidase [Tolypocladium capitatum]
MHVPHLETWQTLVPLAVAYVAVATVVAWIAHLVEPAVLASTSPKYESYRWVKGKRGLRQFFSVAYDCVFDSGSLFALAYDKIRATANEVFLIPFPHSNTGFMLLLPLELIAEYARQPEAVVSFNKYVRDVMHPKYSLFGNNVLDNNIQKPIVYRELFQKLPDKMAMMNEELVGALDAVLHPQLDDQGEMRINMWDTATKFLSRTSNRIIVGYPLCRNQEYLDATVHYAVNMFSLAVYMRFIPSFLQPLLAPLIQRPLKRDRDIVAKHAIPIIKERMKILDEAVAKGVEPNLPNDLLSAAIKVAQKDPNRALEYEPMMLVNRVLAFNFLQSYSNTLTLTNSVYDLISLPQDLFDETVADMRNEVNTQLQKQEPWTHDFVNSLEIMDSFIRESLRANPIGEVGLERTIMHEDGFTFSTGLHVPKGATLAAPLKVIQQDADNYPGGFNPKRALQDPSRPKITTLSPDFLNFGLGRPACPGRWFAANLQKLALSHLLLEYDFVRLEKRPPGVRKVTLVEPCGRSIIVLRKRKDV